MADSAITSNCQSNRNSVTRAETSYSPLSAFHLHENGGNMRYGFASDVRAQQGCSFCLPSCSTDWLLAPLWKTLGCNQKQIQWRQFKTAATRFSKGEQGGWKDYEFQDVRNHCKTLCIFRFCSIHTMWVIIHIFTWRPLCCSHLKHVERKVKRG